MWCSSLMTKGVFIKKKKEKKSKKKIIARNNPPWLVKVHTEEVGVLETEFQHSKTPPSSRSKGVP